MRDSRRLSASAALAAFAESFASGRRVVVFGNALGTLPDLLLDRGARLVHVCDPDPGRAAQAGARNRSQSLSFAPLGEGPLALREGAFDVAVIDGTWDFVGDAAPRRERVVKADATCLPVAAASILAKVTRDRFMREQSEHYPAWSFDTNKGYPCPVHKAALQAWGPSVIHRRTWVFMDHLCWEGMRHFRPEQPALF